MSFWKKRLLLVAGTFLFLLFIANRTLFFRKGFLERAAAKVCSPFLVFSGSLTEFLRERTAQKLRYDDLLIQYMELKERYNQLQADHIKMLSSFHFQAMSQAVVDFQQRYKNIEPKLAKVLVRHFSDHEHYYFLNIGWRHGVKKDMVALHDLQILGRVSEVYDDYCKLLLITDNHCNVAAYASSTKADGIVQGVNKLGNCSFNYVSHLLEVNAEDYVITSGKGLVFPEGFCMGKIVSCDLKEKSLYHTILIEPLVNLRKIKFCVLTDRSSINQF